MESDSFPQFASRGLSAVDTTIRQLLDQQLEIQARLSALLPPSSGLSVQPELEMLRFKLHTLQNFAIHNLPNAAPVVSEIEEARSLQHRCECIESACLEEGGQPTPPIVFSCITLETPGLRNAHVNSRIFLGIDLSAPWFIEVLQTTRGEYAPPPGYASWIEKNVSQHDPVIRKWALRHNSHLDTRNLTSNKCSDDQCVHYIYGFITRQERDAHLKSHVATFHKYPENSGSSPPAFSVTPQLPAPRQSNSDENVNPNLSLRLPRPQRDPRALSLSTGSQLESPYRCAVKGEELVTGAYSRPHVDPLLPPLEHSRVGRPRLKSIGELRLLPDTGICIRCRISHLACDATTPCSHCLTLDASSSDAEVWMAVGCHRGSLTMFSSAVLSDPISPRQTHTPITSPVNQRRSVIEFLEMNYSIPGAAADAVEAHLDFDDGFWWTEDLTNAPLANPTFSAYSKARRCTAPPVLSIVASSLNSTEARFDLLQLLRASRAFSASREVEESTYPVLHRAKLLLREVLFWDLQSPAPVIRADRARLDHRLLAEEVHHNAYRRLLYNCLAQYLQAFEATVQEESIRQPIIWAAVFISLCIYTVVRTILTESSLLSPKRSSSSRASDVARSLEGSAAAFPYHLYQLLIMTFTSTGPMILDEPGGNLHERHQVAIESLRVLVRQDQWAAFGISSTRDFLMRLGAGYLKDNIAFNGFLNPKIRSDITLSTPRPDTLSEGGLSISAIGPPERLWALGGSGLTPNSGQLVFNDRTEQELSADLPSVRRRHTVGERMTPSHAPSWLSGFVPINQHRFRASYQRSALRRVYCDKCNEYPEGFRGEHELRRHADAKHAALTRRWVCARPNRLSSDMVQPAIPLEKCKACVARKHYGAYYNAAAHLRRAHFNPQRGSKASGDWPAMSVLKDWMTEVRQPVGVTDLEDSSGDETGNGNRDSVHNSIPIESELPQGRTYSDPKASGQAFGSTSAADPHVPSGTNSLSGTARVIAPAYPGAANPPRLSLFPTKSSENRNRCPHPDCGREFKDLAAHMLTHQEERPEKCPIESCEYHLKGFARKYDKNRHALTHYKGTMSCPFCPTVHGKVFNRADVFKRHLTTVHNVEQTPPNSRKSISPHMRMGSGSRPIALASGTAKGAECSICCARFSSAQEFYEHLDDCVLRVIVPSKPEP